MSTETKNKEKVTKVSYYRQPSDMTLEEWQIALRRQFAEKQKFDVTNIGDHPVFSDFLVFNAESNKEYKVAIRDYEFGMNFCSCPDFKINGLGTCKHVEFVLKQLKEDKANDIHWLKGYERPYSSVSLKYGEERKVFLRVGTRHSREIKELAAPYFDKNHFLKPEAFAYFGDFITKARETDGEFKVYPDALDYIISVREKEFRILKINRLFPDGIHSDYFNNLIKADLYPYQREGVLFAAREGRVLLADEMGLGKTLQAIATVEIFAREFNISNVLVICPTSLKYQWKNEIENFTSREVKIIEGALDKRKFQYQEEALFKIASYGVALNDVDYLNKARFDLVILDEAQRIKNWKTKTAQNLKKIESAYAMVLTGTPLENKLEELHSLVEFIDKYRLGALFRFLDKHQTKSETGQVTGYHDLHKINEALNGILLRRTKNEIMNQLPERVDKYYFVDVTKEQWDIHQDYENTVNRLVFKWRKQGFLPEPDRKRLLLSLSCMRMVSDSTYILDQKTRYDKKISELVIILKEIFESGNDKVVVFSQWERMTRLVAMELDKMQIGYQYLHGGIPSPKRKDLIDNFRKSGEYRVFLSTDAGGVGLNLQSANIVINLDLPWNPAILEQRIARVHRLGQKKNVRVINLVSKGTLEHKIVGVIGFKKSLFAGVLDGGEDRIVLDGDKFNKLMESVSELSAQASADYETPEEGEEPEFTEKLQQTSSTEKSAPETGAPLHSKEPVETKLERVSQDSGPADANELLAAGLGFLEKLGGAITALQNGKVKVSDFVEKDTQTGKTNLKIPVKDEETVTQAIDALARFFNKLAGNQ